MGEDDENDISENVTQNAFKETESTKNEATKRKTNYWVEKVNDESKNLGVGKNITDMDDKTLNAVLTSCILSSYILLSYYELIIKRYALNVIVLCRHPCMRHRFSRERDNIL